MSRCCLTSLLIPSGVHPASINHFADDDSAYEQGWSLNTLNRDMSQPAR